MTTNAVVDQIEKDQGRSEKAITVFEKAYTNAVIQRRTTSIEEVGARLCSSFDLATSLFQRVDVCGKARWMQLLYSVTSLGVCKLFCA